MRLELLGFFESAFLQAPGVFGFLLLGFYAIVALVIFVANFNHWRQLTRWQWVGVLGLSALGFFCGQFFILHFPANILSPPGLPLESQRPGFAPFVFIPAFLAGGWLGIGPALVVGLITGLSRSLWETYSLLTPLEFGLIAAMMAWGMRQEYRGLPGEAFRHPLFGSLIFGAALWPFLIFSFYAYAPGASISAWDYVWSLVVAALPVFIGEVVIGGVVAELARWGWPQWWPQRQGRLPPPYLSSLNRKLLYTLIPLFMVGIGVLFGADLTIATNVSTDLMVEQMSRAAENVGREVPFFIQSGLNLLKAIGTQEDLLAGDNATQTTRLQRSLDAVPFFKQITLLNANLDYLAGYPTNIDNLPQLTKEEQELIEFSLNGVPQTLTVYPDEEGEAVDVLFIVPVMVDNTVQGVLLGHADLVTNPLMQVVTNNLEGLANGAGQGFLVDERDTIIYHPDPTKQLEIFLPETAARRLNTTLSGAMAYEDKAPDGTRRLVLYYPIPGHEWYVVIMVPNHVVLGVAAQISTPVVAILLIVGLLGMLTVSFIASRLTRPAEALALAAQHISEGQLDRPVLVAGEDEVGRAGVAFERMRQKLRARLEELGMLLRVSQGVASSLNLAEALPPILEGALTATGAAGVRIVLLPAELGATGATAAERLVFAAGKVDNLMLLLDRGVLPLVQAEGRVTLENLARARAVLDVSAVVGQLHALAALPLRQENTFYGVLWLAYVQPHTFTDTEINFLTTLAGQAAVSVANARLFEAADQGRQRLAAILASTPDAVIVTDHKQQVLLLNPAAEAAFNLVDKVVIGQPVAQVLPHPELVDLLTKQRPHVNGATADTVEFQNARGRTLYASASTITGGGGIPVGRVCVLRDVTHFKELDMMKSEFVATVSHDLRAPLTFMRGYATMLPMVGALNDKQKEFGEKIIIGIEQMTELIDDLLDLGRIEAGVGLAREGCNVNDLITEVVQALTAHAADKGLKVIAEVPPAMPLLSGDPTLLRQAMQNFLDNAIKYTPAGGEIHIQAFMDENKFQFSVADTGLGIAPADQAHLFEKFFRVKQRGSTQVKGSGLGLAIVKSIVERHGGRVWVESKLGKGSLFGFDIPRLPLTPAAETPAPSPH